MKKTIKIIWDKIIEESEKLIQSYPELIMYNDSFEVFSSNFNYYCDYIKYNL